MTNPYRPGAPRPGAPRPGAARPVAARPGAKREAPKPNYSTITTLGIEPNIAAALSYILGLFTGLVFLLAEKDNKYIRFHAAQSIVTSVMVVALGVAVSMIGRVLALLPYVGWIAVLGLTMGLAVGTFGLWLLLIWKAYDGQQVELPVAGAFAKRMV
jgi:uncharacterized membrane protein